MNVGPVAGAKVGKINVAFDSHDASGIALNVEATPAAGSGAACIKLGGYTIGQDPARTDSTDFDILNSSGVSVFTDAAAGGGDTQVQYNDGGALGGSAAFTYDKVANSLTIHTLGSTGTPGDYTLAKSGLVMKNAAGDEVFRIWGTDPDLDNNYNAANLYIGFMAGAAQPTDNVSAGYSNIGIGYSALDAVTTGYNNIAIGEDTLGSLTEGYENICIGQCTQSTVAGHSNVFISLSGGPTADVSNAITLGYGATVASDNTAVIGNASLTDVYLGSDAGLAVLHALYLQGTEIAAPAAPPANGFRIFAEDDGAGKTRLMVKFATGAAQQIAIQP